MPRLDGYDATRAIRRLEGPQRHTPIISMTAGAMVGDRDRSLAGMGNGPSCEADAHSRTSEPMVSLWTTSVGLVGAGESPHPGWLSDLAPVDSLTGSTSTWSWSSVSSRQRRRRGMAQLVASFIERSTSRLAELRHAAPPTRPTASWPCKIGHSLKGSSAILGASALAGLCAEIEIAARGHDRSGLGEIPPAAGRRVRARHTAAPSPAFPPQPTG